METVVIEFDQASFAKKSDDGKTVRRSGKIFETGDYPDKGFSLNPEEAAKAVVGFKPVKVNLSHVATVLDGKLGELVTTAFHSDGKTLTGEAELPKWLDDLLEDDGRKVSTEWDKETKQLVGLALTPKPRVEGAALMAAFSEHQTSSGQSRIQELHDTAARYGAVCKAAKFEKAEFVSASESAAMQKIHDEAVKAGAVCEDIKDRRPYSYYDSGDEENSLMDGLDEKEKTGLKKLLAMFSSHEETPPKVEERPNPDAERLAKMEARIKAGQHSTAVAFAERMVSGGKITAADKAEAVAAYETALALDSDETSVVKFGEAGSEKPLSMASVLEKLYSNQTSKAADLSREKVPFSFGNGSGGGKVLFDEETVESVGDRAAKMARAHAGLGDK